MRQTIPTIKDVIDLVDAKIGGFKLKGDPGDEELRAALVVYGQEMVSEINDELSDGVTYREGYNILDEMDTRILGFMDGWKAARAKVPV